MVAIAAKRAPAVSSGRRAATGGSGRGQGGGRGRGRGRGRKVDVDVAVENTPALPSVESVELCPASCVAGSSTMSDLAISVMSSLELGASVECASTMDAPDKCAPSTIMLGKCCICKAFTTGLLVLC